MDWYFAYGSNMNPARMQVRGLDVKEARAGQLKGFSLRFNKRAATAAGHAFANIAYQPGSVVEGVLYRLADGEQISKLDPFEGTPVLYSREPMLVSSEQGDIAAWVYIANPAFREEGLLPSREYLEHLLLGREFLSEAYWAALSAAPTHPD
ncbi:gamma-glutamylcyclotransferase family protein [Pseudomonas sp. EL_65y_Pfl2_R95]|uniref:gamma-glutamylcyclotransferase family protein n=1 Tax=Pseudomonas sp. EL_65y_Pfl2_R95 TaxID=3088698 RepID=UPI0030DDA856